MSGKMWDLAGEQTAELGAVGTPIDQTTAVFTWWPDGEKESVTDANGI